MDEETKNFILQVSCMRDAQRRYFASRDKQILSESINLEKYVDSELPKLIRKIAESGGNND